MKKMIFILLLMLTLVYTQSSAQAVFKMDSLDFGICKTDTQYVKPLVIRNTGNESGTLKAYGLENGSIFRFENLPDFPVVLKPGEELALDVSLSTFNIPYGGEYRSNVGFQAGVSWKITSIRAYVDKINEGTGGISISGANFKDVTAGEERVDSIEIMNVGTYKLPVDTIFNNVHSGFHILGETRRMLEPYERWHVPIRFKADTVGDYFDFVQIVTAYGPLVLKLEANVIEASTGVERVYDPSFYIAPNPATGFTTISLPAFKSRNPFLKVYDALGNEVADLTAKVNGASFNFDTRTLPNGAYFVRFTDGGYTLLRTFVVSN